MSDSPYTGSLSAAGLVAFLLDTAGRVLLAVLIAGLGGALLIALFGATPSLGGTLVGAAGGASVALFERARVLRAMVDDDLTVRSSR